jgi:inhibitor of cysteine peptidase
MFITSIAVICFIAVMAAGCIGNNTGNSPGPATPSPQGTPIRAGNIAVNESWNNATVHANLGDTVIVSLAENPTTGFEWNLTTTPGLNITGTSFTPSDTTGRLVGSGGTRSWDITTAAKGEQHISAAYRRSWEPVTGNETAFALTVIVS